MLNKKYFVLIAVLLVGVVILSGCINGDDLSNGDNETEEVIENAEAEVTLQSMLDEMGNQNTEKAKDYFSDDFSFEYYDYEWKNESLDVFIKSSEGSFTPEISRFEKITDNRYFAFLTLKYPDKNNYAKFEIEFKESNDTLLITEIKDVLPQEEIEFLNNLTKTFDSHDTLEEFLTYFKEDPKPEITAYGEDISDPTELYNNFIANQNITDAKFDFGGYWIENPEKLFINGKLNLTYLDNSSSKDNIDVEIEYNNGELKITSLEIIEILEEE